jgi:RimJ/RimL family protein N-acetyltransferase
MIELAYGFDEPVADFVARHIPGCERGFSNPRAIGVVEDGNLIAGAVYHEWHPEAGVIQMSAAATSPRWLAPKVLHAIFAYPFELIGVQMVVLQVKDSNARMKRIAERFGFTSHRIPRLAGRDEAAILYTLTDDDWRATAFERSGKGKIMTTKPNADLTMEAA